MSLRAALVHSLVCNTAVLLFTWLHLALRHTLLLCCQDKPSWTQTLIAVRICFTLHMVRTRVRLAGWNTVFSSYYFSFPTQTRDGVVQLQEAVHLLRAHFSLTAWQTEAVLDQVVLRTDTVIGRVRGDTVHQRIKTGVREIAELHAVCLTSLGTWRTHASVGFVFIFLAYLSLRTGILLAYTVCHTVSAVGRIWNAGISSRANSGDITDVTSLNEAREQGGEEQNYSHHFRN